MGEQPGDDRYPEVPENMVDTVQKYRMETGISKNHFEAIPCSRVVSEDSPEIPFYRAPETHYKSYYTLNMWCHIDAYVELPHCLRVSRIKSLNLTRLITQEIALMEDPRNPGQAFEWQRKLRKDAFV